MNEAQKTTANTALAIRYVLTLPAEERATAAEQLNETALALVGLCDALSRAIQTQPELTLHDIRAMLDNRRELQAEADELNQAPDLLNPAKGYDPEHLANAYKAALEDTQKASETRRLKAAQGMIEKAQTAQSPKERRALMMDAQRELERAEHRAEAPLDELWTAHLSKLSAKRASKTEVLVLDHEKRGPFAGWINDNLGPRAGLEAGKLFILGGAPGAGKTSLAGMFVVDALAAGLPVLCWQMELGREEMLEHLMAQNPDVCKPPAMHNETPFAERAKMPLPEHWGELLRIPRHPEPEAGALEAAIYEHARKAKRRRNAGTMAHQANGLVVVDYLQLLTISDRRPKDAGHEILATATSRLAKAAADSGACVLALSQINKADQRDEKTRDGTALAGADLQRMADRVAFIQPANSEIKPCSWADAHHEQGKGFARLMNWTKTRGTYGLPERRRVLFYEHESRALHGGEITYDGDEDWTL